MADSVLTDDELESFSSSSSESISNENSVEEAIIRTYFPKECVILSSQPTPLPTATATPIAHERKDEVVKLKLEQMYPRIQKSALVESKLNCKKPNAKEKKKPMKQILPPLYSAITEEPYSPLSSKPSSSTSSTISELDKKLAKGLRDILVGTPEMKEPVFMHSAPKLLPINSMDLACPCDDKEMKLKKEKKEKKDKDKRFTMSDFQPHFMDRMTTEMMFHDGIQNSTVRSLMKGESLPMACLTKEGPPHGVTILAHIRQFHNEFYHLLYTQNLLEIVESRKDLAIIIPVPRLLVTLDATAESTRTTLLYHLVIIPNNNVFQNVDGMLQYETLSGDYIQVESDNGAHYINGVLAKPDVNCTYHIYHVSQILDKRNIVSIASQNGGEEDVAVEEVGEEEEPIRGTETLFISTKICAVPSTLLKSDTSLGALAGKMNAQFYATSHEMKDYIVSGEGEVTLHMNIYNTNNLFSEYGSNKMTDLSRIRPETVLNFSFSGDALTHLDTGDLKMTEYACNCPEKVKLKKSDLERGLVGLSFQLENSPGFIVMMCKMALKDGNCFVSEDQNLLMRFSGESLDSISLNQEALSKEAKIISTSPLDEHHFLEYKLSPQLYKTHINKAEFDSMLLMNGKIKRWFKRRTQEVTDKAKCGYKRIQSLDLRPIPMGYLQKFIEEVNTKISSSNGQGSFITLTAYNKSCNVLSSKSVLAKRFSISTEKGDKVLVYEFNSSEPSASTMDGEYHMLEIQMDASPKLTLHTHSINRKGNEYFTARRNSNVYVFAFDPSNGRLRSVYITLAKTHLGKKILDYRL